MHISRQQLRTAAMTTFNPNRGEGYAEAIFAFLIIILLGLSMFFETYQIPQPIVGLAGAVAGFYFGAKTVQHGGGGNEV